MGASAPPVAGFTTLGQAALGLVSRLTPHDAGVLVVVAGQSNAAGFHVSPDELPAWAKEPDPTTMILTAHGFEPMQPGVNTGTDNNPTMWGPEVAFAHAFHERHPGETLYIVKSAHGSTGLAADPAELDWSPASHGEMYDQTTALVAQAKALTGLRVSSVMWFDGEEDAVSGPKAAALPDNLRDFVNHVRSDWGDAWTNVELARIGDKAGLAYAEQVRAAQDAAAYNLGVTVIDTDDLPLQDDQLHLNGAGQLGLGERFFGDFTPPETRGGEPWWIPGHESSIWPSGWVLSAAAGFALVCTFLEIIQEVARVPLP